MKKKAREVFDKKMARILVLVFFDIIAIALASLFALWIRFDFGVVPAKYLHTVTQYLPIDTLIIIAVFAITGLYTSVWRYASIPELISVIGACVGSDLIIYAYKHTMLLPSPRSYWFVFLAFLIFLTCGVRYSYRIGRAILHAIPNKNRSKNTMIVGGGDAAHILIDEIARNGAYEEYHISCIIDDNKQKQGTRIRGIPIVGNRFMIKDAAEKYQIEQIIIAIPSASKEEIAKIVTECQKTKAEIKILPSIAKTISNGEESITDKIRPIKYEDFLGRDEIVVNNDEIKDNLTGKTILVTGGGGSIGSELCRHLAAMEHTKPGVQIYNLGTGTPTSVLELLAAFEEAAGRKLPHSFAPRRPGDLAECWANPSKANKELNWKTELTVADAMRDTLKFLENS